MSTNHESTTQCLLPVLLILGIHSVCPTRPLADGLHMPLFYEPSIKASWKKIKSDFRFPALPKGKTWSEGYTLLPPRRKLNANSFVRKGGKAEQVLRATIRKMIAVLKYVDDYDFPYDSPPWMYSEKGRKNAIPQALAVLKEIGYQALPYLWESMEEDLRFSDHPKAAGIATFREAQLALEIARQDLRQTMREKEPQFSALEQKIKTLATVFWKLENQLGSEAQKLNGQYAAWMQELETLVSNQASKDKLVKTLKDAREEARRKSTRAVQLAPGTYFTLNGGQFRVSDAYRARLRMAIEQYGPHALNWLKNRRYKNRFVLKEATGLVQNLKRKSKDAAKNTP